ncbi:DUF892 family protein [Patulibacter sp. NPDC049589]|uniref:DUF892 family protein n=1 Tax=Patulibacter sp. NPDC049589 TaxID=3154731 RepID=UPI00342D9A9D
MDRSKLKVVQYLAEAHASEVALVRVLQSQIAMTPKGRFRSGLESHLAETRDHADRLRGRLKDLRWARNPLLLAVGVTETVVGQTLALGKTPLDLLRGTGGEEKILKNAKDAAATEALEIATYTAIEELANLVGDAETARLAASIRKDEERMLERILREIPRLTKAVVDADIGGDPSYDPTETGAADAVKSAAGKARSTADTAKRTAKRTGTRAASKSRANARKVPGVAATEGAVRGAVAVEDDLPIAGYDDRTADEIVARLPGLTQLQLAVVAGYERRNGARTTVLDRIDALRGDEPWSGYDELNAPEIKAALAAGDEGLARKVAEYERRHKDRAGVLTATERRLQTV